MNGNYTFCENCIDYIAFTTKSKTVTTKLGNEIYTHLVKFAYCNNCNCEVFVAKFRDFNLKTLYDEYRKKHNIISLEKIREIPKKYNIGKRELSKLLGWEKLTFTRYYNGDLPSSKHSNILNKIYELHTV